MNAELQSELNDLRFHWDESAPRGALLYCSRSGRELEEVFLGLMTYS
jgi:hypothetical protein